MLRRTQATKRGTVVRLLDSLQDLAADADLRLAGVNFAHLEEALSIVLAKFPAQLEATLGNAAHAAPLAVADFENIIDELLRSTVAVPPKHPRVLVLDHGAPLLQQPHSHQRALKQVQGLESRNDDGHAVAFRNGFVLAVTHDGAHVPRTEEGLHSVQGRLQDVGNGRRHQNVRNQDGNVLYAFLLSAPYQHRVCGRGGLESDGEEYDVLVGICPGNLQAIQRRVNNPHIAALRLDGKKIAFRSRHTQHVAERAEDNVRTAGNGVGLVNHLQRGDAHRAARAVHQFNSFGQQEVEAVFHDRVRLSAADFHDHPGPGLDAADLVHHLARQLLVPVFVKVFHGLSGLALCSSSTGALSSVS